MNKFMSATSIAAALIFPTTAFAQQSGNAEADASSAGEIIVTAQRRSEALQNVPISISVADGARLEANGVRDVRDLNTVVPGLNFVVVGPYANPMIRGVGTTQLGVESNVALYVDGIYSPNQNGNAMALPNVETVQVLKGPQGTLFGRNATGGAILITTSDPTFDVNGKVRLSYGRFNEFDARGLISAPIVQDVLAANFTAAFTRDDGYVFNTFLNKHEEPARSVSLRGKLLLQATPDLKFILTGSYTDRKPTGITQRPFNGRTSLSTTPGINIPTDYWTVSQDRSTDTTIKTYGVSLRAEYDASFGTIRASSSWGRVKLRQFSDADFTSVVTPALRILRSGPEYSHELVLTTPSTKPLSVTAGLFAMGTSGVTDVGVGPATIINSYGRTRAYSAFAELNWRLTDSLKLIAGLRFGNEKKYYESFVGAKPKGSLKSNTWTPRVSLIQSVGNNSNIYASYSRGFASGNFNQSNGVAVDPEYVDAFEVGYKTAQRHINFNVSGFYYK